MDSQWIPLTTSSSQHSLTSLIWPLLTIILISAYHLHCLIKVFIQLQSLRVQPSLSTSWGIRGLCLMWLQLRFWQLSILAMGHSLQRTITWLNWPFRFLLFWWPATSSWECSHLHSPIRLLLILMRVMLSGVGQSQLLHHLLLTLSLLSLTFPILWKHVHLQIHTSNKFNRFVMMFALLDSTLWNRIWHVFLALGTVIHAQTIKIVQPALRLLILDHFQMGAATQSLVIWAMAQ